MPDEMDPILEDRLTIATPEGVPLELTLAGIGSRAIAGAIDLTIQFVVGLALTVLAIGVLPDDALGVALLTVALFVLIFGYDVSFEVLGGGRTPGKRAAGLRVVRDGGRPITLIPSAIRNVLRIVDIMPVPFYGVAMLVVFFSARNQRLGDMAAGTLVVRERKARAALQPLPAAPDPGWDVSAVTTEEAATVRRFLERRASLDASARARLGADLERRLRPKVAGAPPGLSPEHFLEGLAAAKAARGA